MAVANGVRATRPNPRWLVTPVAFVAAALGALAVVSPLAAIVLAGALLFTAVAFHELAAGVALFTAVTFLETLPGVAGSGLGVMKAAGLVLVFAALRRSGTPLLLKEHPAFAFAAATVVTAGASSLTW